VAEQDTFGSLLAGLRGAPGVVPKLRILGSAARSLRRLSPRERGVLLKMAGLGGAEALVERLATGNRETDQAFRRLLVTIEKHPEELGDSVRGLLDPARRAEAASALIHSLDDALNPDEEEPAEAAEDEPGEPAGTPPAPAAGPLEPAGPTTAAQPAEREEPTPTPARRLPPPLPSAGPPGPPRPPQPRPQPQPGPRETEPQPPAEPAPERAAEAAPRAERAAAPEPRPEPEPAVPVPPPPREAAQRPEPEERPDPWAAAVPTAETPARKPAPVTRPSWTPLGVGAAAGATGAVGPAVRVAARQRADLDELLAYRRRLADGAEPTLTELEDRLDDEAPSWTYRRTLQAWIGSASAEELVAGLDRLLALIAAQPRPADRLWCLSALARRHAWADGNWERIAELAGSPALLRRLEGLRLRRS